MFVPITSSAAAGGIANAQGSIDQAHAAVDEAGKTVEGARARLASASSRVREVEANASKASKDVERLKGLLAKDEVSQQMYDAAVAAADAQRAALDGAKSQVTEAETGVRVADASVLAPFSYSQLLWVSVLGFIIFGEVPDIWTVTGAAFIVGSGLYTAHRERIRQSQLLELPAEFSPNA